MLLRLVISGSLLGGLVWMVDYDELLTSVRHADWMWLSAAILLVPVNIGLEVVKWKRMLEINSTPSTMDATGSVLLGYTLGLLTPIRVGEYVGRSVYLGGNHVENGILTGFDRILSMVICIVAGLFAAGVALASGLLTVSTLFVVSVVLGIAAGIVTLAIVAKPSLVSVMWKLPLLRRFRKPSSPVLTGITGLPNLTELFVLSAARQAVYTAQLIILIAAFGGASDWIHLTLLATLVFYVKTLIPQFTFADLGIRESASIFFFGLVGVPAAASLNASLILFALNLVLPAVVGLAFASRLRLPLPHLAGAQRRLEWMARS